ncbi:anti-sigma factor antagonist [Bremerella cremea]|uniref:Anti-sigma factor antagonist n=1 Tax=Bremerella cremea TaxID=1031537 RepID=A0A368KK21_9BACT|nr:STAS domain-containing protein [Bremerella cremea]RCS41107.1 anti-sigma factor antagonist [Bremerella cremea]
MNLELSSIKDNVVHVAVFGKVTQDATSRDADLIADLLGEHAYQRNVLLNLRDAEMVDSSGIGWLLVCHKKFKDNGGRMICHSAPPVVANVFRLMRMDLVFENAANVAEAEKLAGVSSQE